MTRQEVRKVIAEFIHSHPTLTYREIAETLHCGQSTIGGIARQFGIRRQRAPLNADDLSKLELTNG